MEVGITRSDTATAHREADDLQRAAYNGAFWDMGFKWQWDADTYRELCEVPEEKARIRTYLQRAHPHLFKVYDPDFLIDLIYVKKTERHRAMAEAAASGRRADLRCNGL